MQILTDRLAELIGKNEFKRKPWSIPFGRVKEWMDDCNISGKTWLSDAVVLALPAYAAAKVIAECDDVLASELKAIAYASTATINVAFRRSDVKHPLNGFGFRAACRDRKIFLPARSQYKICRPSAVRYRAS